MTKNAKTTNTSAPADTNGADSEAAAAMLKIGLGWKAMFDRSAHRQLGQQPDEEYDAALRIAEGWLRRNRPEIHAAAKSYIRALQEVAASENARRACMH